MLSDSDAKLMALRQSAAAAHRRIKICIEQLEYVLDDRSKLSDWGGYDDIRQVILSLKHVNDFIIGEPTP